MTSRLYDSRLRSPGIGFPSLSRELVRAPRNDADPHDYYAELGVSPSASREEIRTAARHLFVALHPDTGTNPDPERLQRVKNISEVLLDDMERIKYDRTPDGSRLMDAVYRDELSKLPAFTALVNVDQAREALQAKKASPYGIPGRFDYFSVGYKSTDSLKAQQWYHYLLGCITATDHRGRLRLLLWDGDRPAWNGSQEILMVPRRWEPSAFAAKALVTRVIGAVEISNLNAGPLQGGQIG